LVLTAGITARVELPPVKVVVEDISLRREVDFASCGNRGIANLDLGFKPPNGLGIAMDAPAVVGGGYLFFDSQKEAYSGILQLDVAETIAVKAIGLLSRRIPGSSKSFSLEVIMSAQGFAPIQPAFGFTLTGIGGVLGVIDCTEETYRLMLPSMTHEFCSVC
jgi:uncharacterized protein DUF6603